MSEKSEVEQLLSAALASASDVILSVTQYGTITRASASARDIFGDVLGCAADDLIRLVDPRTQRAVLSPVTEALKTKAPARLEMPAMLSSPRGRSYIVRCRAVPIFDERRELSSVLVTIEDVTERERLQGQHALANRLTSLGMVAAGVAHEINNPLAFLSSNIEYTAIELKRLERELAAAQVPPRVREMIGEMLGSMADAQDGADRVRRIGADLRAYSYQAPDMQVIDVRGPIELAVRMCTAKAKGRATLRAVLGNVPAVKANEQRLAQVLVNLIANALDAIPVGKGDQNDVVIVARTGSLGRAEISVTDTGTGMSDDLRRRIFEPFFTTKPAGEGMGLGLSIVRRFVGEMGGELTVESTLGRGTTFRVLLPAAQSSFVAPAVHEEEPSAMARARILVVDDEPMVLLAIKRLLMRDHEVVDLDGGKPALERIRHGDRFDVILCDLVMPDLTGWELYSELTHLAPDQAKACVFLTGAGLQPPVKEFLGRVDNKRLEKPFDLQSLQRVVHEVLGA